MPKTKKTSKLKQKPENRRKRKNQGKKPQKIDQKTSPKVLKLKINYEVKSAVRREHLSKLDDFLNLIKDGAWHSLTQLSEKLSLPTEQLAKISETLSEQGLIQYREEARWVRINPEWSPILSEANEAEEAEHKPTVGTVIIPSQESVKIQNVRITNVTGKGIELSIRVCKKLTEIAISEIL